MKHAFSLIELSIVLVILGLLTGGILAGQSLIRASELRAAVTEYQRYAAATNSFRDKYFSLPGDMSNATRFWGVADATVACRNSTNTGTCDGDGNGIITSGSSSNERFRAWQHLANAGLIEGTYTGISADNTTTGAISGTANSAASKTGGLWNWGMAGLSADTVTYGLSYGNGLQLGKVTGTGSAYGKLFKPEEMWNIDTKLDDGKPAIGSVVIRWWDDCTTSTSNTDLTGEYDLGLNALACSMVVRG